MLRRNIRLNESRNAPPKIQDAKCTNKEGTS
jgi:hypothetical protein